MSDAVEPAILGLLEAWGYVESDGLVTAVGPPPADAALRFSWQELAPRVPLDAVYFHDAVPLVGFTSATAADLRGLRQRLWNYGQLPVLIALEDDDNVVVYDALRSPERAIQSSIDVLARGSIGDSTGDLTAFHRNQVEGGALADYFNLRDLPDDRVDAVLLRNLRVLRRQLVGSLSGEADQMDSVICAAILASYLHDRGVLDESHTRELSGAATIVAAFDGGLDTAKPLLSGLALHFNGDVFGRAAEAVDAWTSEHLGMLSGFLAGDDLLSGQQSLWPYDFSTIPSDMVSRIYETILEESRRAKAAYYTPRGLVNLVLDEVIPLDEPFPGRIIDPACGSGAFLSEAFRRLVFILRSSGSRTDYETLSRELTDNIFGIDLDDAATRLAIFGLYLALLEEVEPRTIWSSVVLPRLYGTNVLSDDAFSINHLREGAYAAVISNPPWQSELTPNARAYLSAIGRPVGDKQAAQAFTWLAANLVQQGANFGLILPAKSTLYNRSNPNRAFRAALFRELDIRTVVDLSLTRRRLFEGASSPTVVLVGTTRREEGMNGSDADSLGARIHVGIKPRRPVTPVLGVFSIAPEDISDMPAADIAEEPFAWKSLLWGSERDTRLLAMLQRQHPTLESVIGSRGWSFGQGIKGAGKQQDARDLYGLPVLNPRSLGRLSPPRLSEERFAGETLHRRRGREFYEGQKLLISRTLKYGRISSGILEETALFTSNLTSVQANDDDVSALRWLALFSASSLAQYWQFFTSASWGVERPSVEPNEILEWPIADLNHADLDRAESLWRILEDRGVTARLSSAIDEFIFSEYRLTDEEQERVKVGVERSRQADQAARAFAQRVSIEMLDSYGSRLRDQLTEGLNSVRVNTISRQQGAYAGVKIQFSPSNLPFKGLEWTNDEWQRALSSATTTARTTALMSQPALLLFDDDAAYVVKTTDADRWTLDAALQDGERVYSALAFGLSNEK